MSIWNFKKGKRDEGFAELDLLLNTATRQTAGFRGYISLLSKENSNVATVLTLWQDEDSLKASETGVFAKAVESVDVHLEGKPHFENYLVFSTELLQK